MNYVSKCNELIARASGGSSLTALERKTLTVLLALFAEKCNSDRLLKDDRTRDIVIEAVCIRQTLRFKLACRGFSLSEQISGVHCNEYDSVVKKKSFKEALTLADKLLNSFDIDIKQSRREKDD